ncbi:hypothetical protein EDB85DRAFT_1899608 [Lactarius pseudohatsudake]|nr:hypothetical protein EDB85DRAFT_1899608 [Lactarius pseudohatsudake]
MEGRQILSLKYICRICALLSGALLSTLWQCHKRVTDGGIINHGTLYSICILVDDKLVVRNSPFNISVPSEEEIGEFVNYVKNATPSVRDKDHGKFSFYQPPLDCPIRVTESLPGSQLTRKDLGTLLLIPFTVGEVFQEKGADRRFDIDVIVHLDYGENGGGVVLHTLRAGSSNTWLRRITFHLRNRDEAQLPPETELDTNNISEFSADSDGALPDFIEQLEQELRLRRSPRHDMTILPLLASVKAHLGDDTFGEHFTDVNDGSETHRVTDIELLHYLDALIDRNLSNQAAYRNRTESHVYSLLSDAPWIFGLAVKTRDNQILHQYTPRSDVFFGIGGFPHVLLEISSDKKKRDHCRMLLQASRLVRLGNMLISDKSPTFFVKVFYINNDYNADEFTLYQRHHESGPGDDKVEYHKDSHVLSDKHAMFKESVAPKTVPAVRLNGGTKALKKVSPRRQQEPPYNPQSRCKPPTKVTRGEQAWTRDLTRRVEGMSIGIIHAIGVALHDPLNNTTTGGGAAAFSSSQAACLDPPDQHHFRSAAFQKRRARAEAFHKWAFDWHLARVEGEWRELTRGLPPEGHAHTHVLLRPPDGNNHPLWTAATDCERDDKNRKILSRPLYKRCSTSTAFQLAVDHAFTGSYAARFRPNDPPNSVTCPCGWGLRDPPHLIPSCPRFFNNRIDSGVLGQYWPLTYSQLFTTSKGTKRLMDYLQSSRAGSQPEFGPLLPPPEPD